MSEGRACGVRGFVPSLAALEGGLSNQILAPWAGRGSPERWGPVQVPGWHETSLVGAAQAQTHHRYPASPSGLQSSGIWLVPHPGTPKKSSTAVPGQQEHWRCHWGRFVTGTLRAVSVRRRCKPQSPKTRKLCFPLSVPREMSLLAPTPG